jgi:MoaA/NifB/PqqE/SkfB family radical SAM enzyme
MVPLEKCLAAAEECEAPMVSICGGEPLIYPKIEELVKGILAQGRIVYICTNGMFMRKKMKDYLASIYNPETEPQLKKLLEEKLISDKDAETIRKADPATRSKPVIGPSTWMYWNVHVDGLEFTHDLIVEREGVFKECVEAIKMAKILGYQVATNTTVYKETDVREIEEMFKFFSWLGCDGHTISPGYDYDAAKKDMVKRLAKDPKDFFLTRDMTRQKFAKILDWGKAFTIFGTPVYQEFLAGKRELTCTAWAIPTYNVRGWKAPCYLMTDGHYSGYQEMLTKVEWEKYGVVDGKARDPRCENCMVHCGYDPSGALGTNYQRGDNWKNFKYNFWPRPKPYPGTSELLKTVYNGVSIGKGHLAEAKAAISPAAGARGVFSNAGHEESHAGSSCGDGNASSAQRDELLAKIKEAGKTDAKMK